VFDAILEKAMRLCEVAFGVLFTPDGEYFHAVAARGVPPALAEYLSHPFTVPPGSTFDELVSGVSVVQLPDVGADDRPASDARRAGVELGGARTALCVALRKDDEFLGAFFFYRQEVRPFTDKQIALLQNFAAQAVVAMENARLLTETREALEQQTATAEVLQVINSSPGDLTPVFDAILEKAHSLCGAEVGTLAAYDGEHFHALATFGYSEQFAAFLRRPFRPNVSMQRLIEGERVLHLPDQSTLENEQPDAETTRAFLELTDLRTTLFVALRKDTSLLGYISAHRHGVRPFSEKEIALLENFAAQAVIAIENARLLTETREALEQQTATAEILRIISSSPTDVQPTLDAIAASATILTGAVNGAVARFDGSLIYPAAYYGWTDEEIEAVRREYPRPPSRETTNARAIMTREVVHIPDITADPEYRARGALQTSMRTALAVPILQDGNPVGAITVTRREVAPFSQPQIDLLKTFADQAVIAIENVRLFNELNARTHDLEESLEYQTATSDVLKVISRSTFDLQPVLDTLVETASGLCDADFGALSAREGDAYRVRATFALVSEFDQFLRGQLFTPSRVTVTGRALLERQTVHIPDALADPELVIPEAVTTGRLRTMLGVPLLREGEPLGVLVLSRQRVEPFSEQQIELVRTFADQAVIAIENTRLLTELRESLEQQQAIAEVLQVINSSPGDLAPVFDAILEKAHSLCGVGRGSLQLYDGEYLRVVATRGEYGVPSAVLDRVRQGYRASDYPVSRPLLDGARFVYIADLAEIDHPLAQAAVELAGTRSLLFVPLRREGALLGLIASARQEVVPFLEKEIALLESFAAQAVIAMDNARLLNEIRQRQAELRVTFDNMGDGVAMFDGELRLAAWNLNFQRLLDLPEALLAERPRVPDFVRYLATRGEYGAVDVEAEVRRLSESAGTQWSTERTRPDGRVIEVRNNPVPSGGSVLIYSDVTERKRAEAEIRAARDAAEKALGELQTAQASLVHAQKMAALGQLTAGIAHEIKNPLNFVNNFAELSGELLQELRDTTAPVAAALDDDTRAEVDEIVEMLRANLAKIAEHGKRADGIVKSMLEHSRGVSGERRVVDLNGLIDEALNLAYHGARAQDASFNVTLERDFDQGLAPIDLAPQEMTRVLLNLFGNGFYAAIRRQRDGAGPEFRPTLRVTMRDLGKAVEIRVRDNGTGIAPEVRDKLFQPFVTTKPTGEGTGLGLSIAYDIVTQQHGGTIAVDSTPGEFTEFTIRLPRRPPP
jgi:GAF domain-containing protein